MAYPILQRELTIQLNTNRWNISQVDDPHILGPVDYGWVNYKRDADTFSFGEGLLAGSSIPGSRRLVFCAWSPQWEGFYVSSMGGAAYTYHRLGVSYVALHGKAVLPSILLLNHHQGEVHVRQEPIDVQTIWRGITSPMGQQLIGFFALQQIIYDRYKSEYPPEHFRIMAVGPASLFTKEGAIGSSPIQKSGFSPIEDWAGRGGLGSRLLQFHNIVGIVFGGEWQDPDLRDSNEIDTYFMENFGQNTIQTDIAVTKKYRFVPEFETGGTFGVNMHQMHAGLLSFNYNSIYMANEARIAQHEEFIIKHYLAQFNEETIKLKKFLHCGEPCPVVCKKYRDIYKKDFEPYQALGPQVGVFDQRAAELLNHHIDSLGFDAIQSGGTLAWILELVADEVINPEDYHFPPVSELRFKQFIDLAQFDVVQDSMKNALYAIAVANALLYDPNCRIFREGIRTAAKELDRTKGIQSIDRAVYLAHGENGCMVPNQYWTPGMFSPMPVMGKYYCFYELEFVCPETLGRKNVERMTYELFNDNSGVCRFHRKWAEFIVDEILNAHYALNIDYKNHQFSLAKEIYHAEGGTKAIPWESARVIDIILGYLEQWESGGLMDEQLSFWLGEFRKDKQKAGMAYWAAINEGIQAGFDAGPNSIPNLLSPLASKDANSSDRKTAKVGVH